MSDQGPSKKENRAVNRAEEHFEGLFLKSFKGRIFHFFSVDMSGDGMFI